MKINLIYRILLCISAALACSACSMADMNMLPEDDVYVDVEITGRVVYLTEAVDKAGEKIEESIPVPDIVVSLFDNGDKVDTHTNPNGIFIIERKGVYIGRRPNLRLTLSFTDIDGYANGGKFIERIISKPVEVVIANKPMHVDMFDVIIEAEPVTATMELRK